MDLQQLAGNPLSACSSGAEAFLSRVVFSPSLEQEQESAVMPMVLHLSCIMIR